jgi:hypothetical protein
MAMEMMALAAESLVASLDDVSRSLRASNAELR